jgi:CRP/FNR family transcriptional regulator, cyclic AMP receptor protein
MTDNMLGPPPRGKFIDMESGAQSQDVIGLLDLWPELVDLLDDADLDRASRTLVLRWERVPPGPWKPAERARHDPSACLVVVGGLLVREAIVASVTAPEFVGAGDVVHVAADRPDDLLGSEVSWTVLDDARVAWLTASTFSGLASWPAVQAVMLGRATERSSRQAVHQAICHHLRVEARIVAVMWHMAERWGRVTPAGVVLPLRLTHDALATLVGAKRPTVSTALGHLAERGVVRRSHDGSWILSPDTEQELQRVLDRARQTSVPTVELINPPSIGELTTLEGRLARVSTAWEEHSAAVMRLRQRSNEMRDNARSMREKISRLRAGD